MVCRGCGQQQYIATDDGVVVTCILQGTCEPVPWVINSVDPWVLNFNYLH